MVNVAASRAQYRCDGCGRDLSEFSLGRPCPCGAIRRRRTDADGAVFRRPLTVESPRWDPFKDWSVKYLQFTWNVMQLRWLYAPGSGADAAEVRRIVERTFASCSNLAEWLSSGPEPVSVTPGDVAQFVKTEPLSVSAALTTARSSATSRIIAVGFAEQPRYWIEYQQPGAKPLRYDALDLAEQCLRAWHAFLTERAVELPTWQDSSRTRATASDPSGPTAG
jgi:hypothetical protein